ncbi:MAG: peptidoglycan DD-metalloendopeptidase family protein [Propionibacteriales bacterium]|nr:peptidoglycan DD-metalloendopeptidase family protein [Propionibacteriales bacterium]
MPKNQARAFTRPSASLIAGISALVVAAAGATSVGAQAVDGSRESSQVATQKAEDNGMHAGTDGLGPYLTRDGKPIQVSRGNGRAALNELRQARLEAAAERQVVERKKALSKLAALAEERADELKLEEWVLPISGYDITATFGASSSLWSTTHTGLDFAATYGTPVASVATGIVTEVGSAGAYGNRVIVTHEDGSETWYCHLDSYTVSTGDQVSPGTQVGAVGMSGNTTGPHLHFEVRPSPDVPVDPYGVLAEHGLEP